MDKELEDDLSLKLKNSGIKYLEDEVLGDICGTPFCINKNLQKNKILVVGTPLNKDLMNEISMEIETRICTCKHFRALKCINSKTGYICFRCGKCK